MKNLKLIVMFLAIAGMSLSACKKEETETPAADKKTLISKTWKISEYYIDGQVIQDPVITSARITFVATGTYTAIFDGDTENGTWAFNSAQDRVILNGGTAEEQTWNIVELTSSKFKVTFNDDGTAYEIIYAPA